MLKSFSGGKHISDQKQSTADKHIDQMPIMFEYYVALSQHIGKPAKLVVAQGDVVAEGQLIAQADGVLSANIHSPVCGEVVDIVKRKDASGAVKDYVHIHANGNRDVRHLPHLSNNPTREKILERIAEAGIVGMGGAGFPAAVKYQPKDGADTLVVNAAECEPYLNCDNRLIIERAAHVAEGIRLVAKACGTPNIVVGIEANKPRAAKALLALDGVVAEGQPAKEGDIVVVSLAPKYPQGAEKMLIYACTGRKVPVGALPSAVGCIVANVATCYAVYEAVTNGTPLYKRVMTLSGGGLKCPKNVEVRIGTQLSDLLEFCDGLTDDTVKLVMGGPMMGRTLASPEYAISKTDSGFLALTEKEASTLLPTPCIRCGRCVSVCPMKLSPLYIDFYATAGDTENAVKYGALNCFECGSCAFVCPAKRPIVQSVRLTKIKAREKK